MERINGASLFSSAGIAELYLKQIGIDIKVANELITKRCELHEFLYPDCKMIRGDITNETVFEQLNNEIHENKCKFLLATPPCQGMSSLGKKEYLKDKRNYLVFYVFDIIDDNDFDFILIENVPKFLDLFFPYNGKILKLLDICKLKYSEKYNIDSFVLNAKDYGVPQSRPRGFIRIWRKGLLWAKPEKQAEITLKDCIGYLPSLNPGEDSGIKWHYAKEHNSREVLAMRHTPEGKSALLNKIYYPKKANGDPIKGFHNTYKRMKWDEPSPARAMNSGNLGGHNNCHPGKKLSDGTYSDPRVLTLRELFIVSSINPDWNLPNWVTDNLIRQVIGEAIPPVFAKEICCGILDNSRDIIKLNRSKEHKWIFQKNISSTEIMQQFISISNKMNNMARKEEMMSELRTRGLYHGRSESGSANTMGVRMSQMKFYMFGYSLPSSKKSFFLSPMSVSLLRDRTEENVGKMCLVNLFSMQYPHPFSDTKEEFRIYFGRLLIKLLLETKLEKKLYIDEACYFLPFLEKINQAQYEKLVESILKFRSMSFEEKDNLFKQVKNSDDVFSNVFHEFNYYFLRIFKDLSVLDIVGEENYNDGKLHSFRHGKSNTFRNDAFKARGNFSGYFRIKESLSEHALNLVEKYSPFETPQVLSDFYSVEDFILELYQKQPAKYLSTIIPTLQRREEVSNIIFNMVYKSRYGSVDGQDFEEALIPLFDLFKQAENVEHISGSGDTDILCTMRAIDNSLFKINIDAKKSSGSTSSLNAARLTKHLKIHDSRYCIVVSSKFASGVSNDIAGSDIVAITADTLGKYCINAFNISSDGYIDFTMIDHIIRKNLGGNISNIVQEFVDNYYGV